MPDKTAERMAAPRLRAGPDARPQAIAVRSVADLSTLAPLFGSGECGADQLLSQAWFANFLATCLDPGDRVRFDVVTLESGRSVVLPVRANIDRLGPLRGWLLSGLSTVYSCRFAPVGIEAIAADEAAAAMTAWAQSVRGRADRPSRILFEALAGGSAALEGLDLALRRAGYWIERFAQFGTWYLPVAGLGMDEYWAGRPAALRNTVRRKAKALGSAHKVEIAVLSDETEADRAVAAYDHVHVASWKPPERYPAFVAGLIRTGLACRMLRVGLLAVDGTPVAVQVWLFGDRRATIFKLSHDEGYRTYSVGSILTRHMIAETLAAGEVDEIDFGWGDDAYKKTWLPHRRQHWGLVAYDPASACGLAQAVRNLVPRAVRRLLRPPGRGQAEVDMAETEAAAMGATA